MFAKFHWIITEKASEDLERNIEFRVQNSDYPEDAYQLADSVAAAMSFLCQVPRAGRLYVDYGEASKNVYQYALKNGYVIYYQIRLADQEILVLRILSSRQDQRSALGL